MNKSKSCVQVAGYIRVSSARQASEGDSLPAQRAAIHREAERRQQNEQWDRYEIEFYEDAGRSGKDQNRPELQRLRDDIETGKIDEVIAYKIDRITRSITDFADLWSFFERYGINLVCIRDNFDTDTAMGRAMLNTVMVFAQLERELTGERTRATMLHRAEQGMWNHRPPYGYRIGEDGKLTIDLEFARVIQKHFFDAAERLGSIGAVTRHVRQLGILVPKHTTRTGKTFGGKPFERRQVQKVLTNRAYLGELEWGGVSVEGVHEPLIVADQFDRVQRVLERARAAYSNPQDHGERVAVLKGLVKCGRCGAAMTPYSSTGRGGVRHHYYACTGRIHGTKNVCDQPYIPAQAFEDAIVARCVELARSDSARDRIIGVAVKQAGAEIHRLDDEAAVVKRRLTEIAKEEANLVSVLRAMGETGLQSVESDLRRLQAEKRELGKELAQIAERKGQFTGLGEAGEMYLRAWEGLGDLLERATPEEQCKLIQHVVETIVWNPCEDNLRKGSYTIRFFPDVVDDRPDLLVEQWPEKNNGSEGSDPLLSPVRKLGWEAPRSERVPNVGRECKLFIYNVVWFPMVPAVDHLNVDSASSRTCVQVARVSEATSVASICSSINARQLSTSSVSAYTRLSAQATSLRGSPWPSTSSEARYAFCSGVLSNALNDLKYRWLPYNSGVSASFSAENLPSSPIAASASGEASMLTSQV